jgi:two-component system nitrogen regulation sensor histidine kinase NtrY
MTQEPDEQRAILHRKKKKRRILYVILSCACLIPILSFLEKKVVQVGAVPFPVSGNVLAFILINVNVILLLLMVFLVLRNLVELVFDKRRKILGTKLRTKLVISFVSLSLIPTTLLFFIALQFVSTSMDYWFNINVDQSLEQSLNLAQGMYKERQNTVREKGADLANQLETLRKGVKDENQRKILTELVEKKELTGVSVVSPERVTIFSVFDETIGDSEVTEIPAEYIRRGLAGEQGLIVTQAVAAGELIRSLTPVHLGTSPSILVTSLLVPGQQLEQMESVSKGIAGYRQLQLLKKPIKTSLLVMLLIVTLLIIFSAIWFGFYVADGLTKPMDKLAHGIAKVAAGELDFVLERESGDEMGKLVDSFNKMTKDLLSSRLQVEDANKALKAINLEIDNRRRYTEIILQNVTAGVISLDEQGRVLTINHFAEDLLKINKEEVINKNYRTVLRYAHLHILEGFFEELNRSGKLSIQKPLRVTVGGETLSLIVNFTKLEDDEGKQIGLVIVFDNLTELEKIQRMAAWREVARRIAHEIKNPLTPIQLSAQRLRKKYLARFGAEGDVFDSCTTTIINQVDSLKRLVSEFSSFARMPSIRKSINSLVEMVREILVLYEQAHKKIQFHFIEQDIPRFAFDPEQMKRVLVNLLDNAVAVLQEKGDIEIEVSADLNEKLVFLEVRDNGAGVADADKLRLFEPYFSTKKSGTGLGLAIASTVVADHGGYIRVKDNMPKGARFIVELPLVMEI